MTVQLTSSTDHNAEATASQRASDQARQLWRFWFIVVCFLLMTGLVVLRLLDYQVVRWGGAARGAAVDAPVARGVIVDRDGQLLAGDRYFYRISATPSLITPEQRPVIADLLQQLTGLPALDTYNTLTQMADGQFAVLAPAVNLELGQKIQDWKDGKFTERLALTPAQAEIFENVYVEPTPRRFYPQAEVASHLLGFVSSASDRTAHNGLERYYDAFLRETGVGLTGKSQPLADALAVDARRFVPSAAGKDLVLTLDRTVQWIIEQELQAGLAAYGAQSGSIIVMEPETGAILGMANYPAYNPNFYAQADGQSFTNAAVSAQYEPGSIFKTITFAAAIDAGITEPDAEWGDPGVVVVGGQEIRNSDLSAHGTVTTTEALARSLNVVTAQVAQELGARDFYRYVHRFGFGEATEIDLAGEIRGALKSPGNPEWSRSDLGTNSFGQGVAVTPIQMVNAVAAIANGGRLMRPYMVAARVYGQEAQLAEPTMIQRVISAESAATMTEMMVRVVETGNYRARINGYSVAGKSGTAQIPTAEGYLEDETIVSFVGFVPADDPRFVMLVKMDRPDQVREESFEWASNTAAPLFSRTATRLLNHLNVPPDAVRLGTAEEVDGEEASGGN